MIYPSDYASYVWVLSGGNLSPEKEHWLLWELPLRKGNQYYAAAMLNLPMQQGLRLVKLGEESMNDNVAKLEEIVRCRMKNRK